MSWILSGVLFIMGIVVGLILGIALANKVAKEDLESTIFRFERTSATDRVLLLGSMRRDIANILVRRDPDRFLQMYKEVFEFSKTVGDLSIERRKALLKEITDEMPYYTDFGLLTARDFVLLSDAASSYTDEELEEHFRKLVRFQAIMTTLDDLWSYKEPITKNDIEYAPEYIQRIKDTLFRQRVEDALSEYWAYCRSRSGEFVASLERPQFSVKSISHFAEYRLGIHLKETNEYGLYGSFTYDDGNSTQSIYRSNATFTEEKYLDHLRMRERI